MTDYTAMFRDFEVPVRDAEKLFYNQFPFKILISDPIEKPVYRRGFSYYSPTSTKASEEYVQARAKFLRQIYRTVKCEDKDWRWMDNNTSTLSYFFRNADDAVSFAKKNKKHLLSIIRPCSSLEVEAMFQRTNDKTTRVIRENLFWNKYRYCIQFKRTDEASAAADEFWETHGIPNNVDDRAMYSFGHDRRLYLTDEVDLVFARMGVGQYFKNIQKAILKSEIVDADEPEFGPQAD